MPHAVLILIFAFLATWCGFSVVTALRTGEIAFTARYGRTRHFARRANPRAFWTVFAGYAFFGLFSAAVAVTRLIFG